MLHLLDYLKLLGGAWVCMAFVMSVLWVYQKRTGDSGIVDVVWGLGVAGCAVVFACLSDGLPARRWALLAVTVVWSLRLSGYVLLRGLSMKEDGRYAQMKEDWGESAQKKMFRFYQAQAAASVLFSVPMLIAVGNQDVWGLMDTVGLVIGFGAILGEATADWQLHRFRNNAQNRGEVCQVGLWHFSRHPNYFFEWLHWWSYPCFAYGWSGGLLSAVFPMVMLYFLFFKTGIPPTEQQAIASRGDKYRQYQQEVSVFVPWPRSASGSTTPTG